MDANMVNYKYNPEVGQELEDWITENMGMIKERCRAAEKKFDLNGRGLSPNDVYSEALLATFMAYMNYTDTKDCKFSSYVYKMINFYVQSMYNKTNKYDLPFKISRRVKELAFEINKQVQNSTLNFSELNVDFIQEKFGVSKRLAVRTMRYLSTEKPVRLNSQKLNEEGIALVDQTISIKEDDTNLVVKEITSLLSEQEVKVVNLLMKNETATNIAKAINVSRPTAYKLIKEIKYKIKEYYKSSGTDISDYDVEKANKNPGRVFEATSPDGQKFVSDSPIKFAYKYHLNQSTIYAVLRGKQTHHKQWKFKYIEEDKNDNKQVAI